MLVEKTYPGLWAIDVVGFPKLRMDEDVHGLVRVDTRGFFACDRLDSIYCALVSRASLAGFRRLTRGVGRRWRRQVVLEQHVVLVRNAADAPEDIALHEVFDVRPESINDLARDVSAYSL
jgi:hypothetical protein